MQTETKKTTADVLCKCGGACRVQLALDLGGVEAQLSRSISAWTKRLDRAIDQKKDYGSRKNPEVR